MNDLSDQKIGGEFFIDCYWDEQENLFVRRWMYLPSTGSILGRAYYSAIITERLYGFAVSEAAKKDLDSELELGKEALEKGTAFSFSTVDEQTIQLLKDRNWGRWEKVTNKSIIDMWDTLTDSNAQKRAVSLLSQLNTQEYLRITSALEKLQSKEQEDKSALGNLDVVKDFPKLSNKRDEPAYIRECRRWSLRSIRNDIEKWFYDHDLELPEDQGAEIRVFGEVGTSETPATKPAGKPTIEKLVETYIEAVLKYKAPQPQFEDLEELSGVNSSTWTRRWSELGFLNMLLDKAKKMQSSKFSKRPEKRELFEQLEKILLQQITVVHSGGDAFSKGKLVPLDETARQKSRTSATQSDPFADLPDAMDDDVNKNFGKKKTTKHRDGDSPID